MEARCHNCKFYNQEESLCNNEDAFNIRRDYPTLNNTDGSTVVIRHSDGDNIMVPENFGCIHFEEIEQGYPYEDDDEEWT